MTDYPTSAELETVRTWPYTDSLGWFAHIRTLWNYADIGYWAESGSAPGEVQFDLSTGGWSGNEDLIAAMQDNAILWSMHWVQSRRGGHYRLCVRTEPCPKCQSATRTDGRWTWCSKCLWADPEDAAA